VKNTDNFFALRLLRAFCPAHLCDELEGDLIQMFNHDVKMIGERRAKRRLIWSALRFFRPGIIFRNKFSIEMHQFDLFLNNIKFAARAFRKDKFFSGLNILGLALGIAVSIILLLILQNEFTYDEHYAEHKRIYRLGAHYQIEGTDTYIGSSARELAPILRESYPEIEELVRIKTFNRQLVKENSKGSEKAFYEENVAQADSTYFKVFKHEFVGGDVSTCLNDPHNVVITETMARKYFDTSDPLDRTLLVDNEIRTVSGVIKDFPDNTHLKFDFLLSGLSETRPDWDHTMENGKTIPLVFWNPDVYTYLLMPNQYNVNTFYSRFTSIYNTYFKDLSGELNGNSTPILQPLADIHFSNFDDDGPQGNITYLYAFSGIGIMIVVLACINYMNLSTAKAVNRATEVAIKKVMGFGKRSLTLLFLSESLVLSLISLIVAIVIVLFVLNATSFNQLIGKNLNLDFIHNSILLGGSIGIALIIGIISGMYPAFYLPAIPATAALKGKFKSSRSSYLLRKGLITTQFVISLFVVLCAMFMHNQIDYVQNKDLGFDKNNVLVVPIQDESVQKSLQTIKNELLKNKNIVSAAGSASVMGMGIGGNVMFGESKTGMQQQGGILGHFVSDDYLKTMGISLVSGRDFRPGDNVDEDGMYIANEAVVKLMGWGDNPLGKKVTFWGGENPGTVIGVVKDFNSSSLHQNVEPMFMVKGHWSTGYLQIRLTGEDLPGTINFIKEKWSRYDTNHPFEYFFLDQRFNEQYKEDVIQNKLLTLLSGICIFISLLGLVGLSAFTATQRTKEIGVKKVLGAGIPDIIFLLSKDVLVLVVLSSLLVMPLSYWVTTRWLENFAYRADLNYLLYLFITLVAGGIVFLVILLQSIRTANTNPVDTLKYE
jgi:putative ABC transport system permease protein